MSLLRMIHVPAWKRIVCYIPGWIEEVELRITERFNEGEYSCGASHLST